MLAIGGGTPLPAACPVAGDADIHRTEPRLPIGTCTTYRMHHTVATVYAIMLIGRVLSSSAMHVACALTVHWHNPWGVQQNGKIVPHIVQLDHIKMLGQRHRYKSHGMAACTMIGGHVLCCAPPVLASMLVRLVQRGTPGQVRRSAFAALNFN